LFACVGDDGEASRSSSSTSDQIDADDDRACELLQGNEFSKIPEAVEFRGLDGSVRYLRRRGGVNIAGDVLVFLEPARSALDQFREEVAQEVAEIEGATVVGTLDQDQIFAEFISTYGDTDQIIAEAFPALIAVEMSGEEARAAVEALRNREGIYDLVYRDELATRLVASLRLVQEQFDDELRQLVDVGQQDVADAAENVAALGSDYTTPSEFTLDVIAATQVLIDFADEACPTRPQPGL
jgi:hypothetical protein